MSSRKKEVQRCHRKLRHLDYLSALLHAKSLAEEYIVIYPCETCGGLHLGHNRPRYEAHRRREGDAKAMSLQKRIAKHERIAREHEGITERLRSELQSVFIVYDPQT